MTDKHASKIRALFVTLVTGLFLWPVIAQAQSSEERARIGRLQSAQTPCPPQPATDAERMACSQRAMAREIGRQDGYCWPQPNQGTNSPAYLCEPRRNR